MSLHLRVLTVSLSLGTLMVASSVGQEAGKGSKPAESSTTAPRAGYDPARRVPAYFGQIGLTPEQREKVYQIKGKHLQKIDALKAEIEAVESRMMAECEGVLTAVQKDLLRQRRDSSKAKKTAAKGEAAGTASDGP